MVPLARKKELWNRAGERAFMNKRFWFWPIYGLVLLGIVLPGAEYIAWPADRCA